MKKRYIVWPLLLLAFSILSCGKEMAVETPDPQPVQPEERDPWTFYPEEETVLTGEPHTLTAGFESGTKSQLVNDGHGNFSVNWSKNDEFRVYGFGSGSVLRAIYTASAGGASAQFTTFNNLDGSTRFAAVYPESAAISTSPVTVGEDRIQAYWTDFPTVQIATPGSVAEEANISYAYTENLDNGLKFKNVVALLRFRLSGAVADHVTSVTLTGTDYLAGGFAFIAPGGEPAVLPNVSREGFEKSKSITLSGNFEQGKDYFIALVPGIQEGITMVFANGNRTITKVSSKNFTFERSKITDFGTIKLGDTFTETVNTDPILYISAKQDITGATKPVSIAVIPDGFTAGELANYEMQAKAGIDAMFDTEPYKSYKDYFNVWILKVASNESGATISDVEGGKRDCYFGSSWGKDSYNGMKADADKVFDFVTQNCPDISNGTHSIAEVPVLLIINDSRYGGIAWSWTNGQTYCMVPTTAGGLRWGYPAQQADPSDVNSTTMVNTTDEEYAALGQNVGTWRNTLVHEFGGHSFGRLGDEYWYDSSLNPIAAIAQHSYEVPMKLNISASSTTTPWDMLLENGTVKTSLTNRNPLYGRIGIYQGGDVSMFNRWRSEKISCMIDNRFYFSTWQRYLIVKRIRTLAGITAELTLEDFLAKDVPTDPVRDLGSSSPVMGVSNAIPPRPVPMLPPPVEVRD